MRCVGSPAGSMPAVWWREAEVCLFRHDMNYSGHTERCHVNSTSSRRVTELLTEGKSKVSGLIDTILINPLVVRSMN